MAINMTTVKKIMHNNKEVAKIEDSLGNILWQKEIPVTLYEGYYLRSYSTTKDTNYIDLGIKWNSNYKIEGHYYRPNVDSNWSRLLGTGWGTTREIQIDYPVASGSSNQRQLIGNVYNNNSSNTSSTNTRYGFALGNRGSNCESWYWSQRTDWQKFGSSWSNSLGISDYNLRLFSATQGDRDGIFGISDVKINGPSDLWSDEGALMLLVPAKKGDTYGMYDKNNNVFYPATTSGSGYFRITNVADGIAA